MSGSGWKFVTNTMVQYTIQAPRMVVKIHELLFGMALRKLDFHGIRFVVDDLGFDRSGVRPQAGGRGLRYSATQYLHLQSGEESTASGATSICCTLSFTGPPQPDSLRL